jgi:alanine dehydrogenase
MIMKPIHFTYLNGPDVEQLGLTDAEVLSAVEQGLKAQGDGETVIEPRVHLVPEHSSKGHFNILRGYVKPLGLAGIKVVGDFVDNYKRDLPSELATLTLLDPETGVPKALLDATAITDMRTGATTALGAKHLARKDSRILGQIVAGRKPGRESEGETILFWHRGLSRSDIALGHALLVKAARLGIGQTLRFA